jgi:hypothetical protein
MEKLRKDSFSNLHLQEKCHERTSVERPES